MELVQSVLQVAIWFLAIPLVVLILLQGGSGDLSSTFGGGGQLDSTLGVGASRKMGKLTAWMSVSFMVIVLLLNVPVGSQSVGDLDLGAAATPVEDPAVEAAAPAVGAPVPAEAVTVPAEAAAPPAEAAAPPAEAAAAPAEAAAPPAEDAATPTPSAPAIDLTPGE